jgi:hypothetical protein
MAVRNSEFRASDDSETDEIRAPDRGRWLDQFVHLMGHTGNYTREEAIAAINGEGTVPDVLSFDPSRPAKYPNGRVFTDDVVDYRIAFLISVRPPASSPIPTS